MKILVLLDDPATDEGVLRHVSGLVADRWESTELHLVRPSGLDAAGTALPELAARHCPRHAVKTAMLDGCLATALIDYVRTEPADLIVMAENADSNLDEMLLFAGVGPLFKVKPANSKAFAAESHSNDYSGLVGTKG